MDSENLSENAFFLALKRSALYAECESKCYTFCIPQADSLPSPEQFTREMLG